MKRRRRAANALLLVLMVMPMLLTVVLMIGHSSTVHLNMVAHHWASEQALSLARSAVVTAAAEIAKARSYGVARDKELRLSFPSLNDPSAYAKISFKPGGAFSTNNGQGSTSVEGYGRQLVPRNAHHLVGIGHYRGITRTYEVILAGTPFDRALSSSGSIRSTGGLMLGALKEGADAKDGVTPDELSSTTLVCNGEGQSLEISGQATLMGDIRTAGTASLDSSVTHTGRLIEHADPEELPRIKVTDYDTKDRPGLYTLGKASYSDNSTYSGFLRRQGDLHFQQGLKLDNGVLYVDGDLEVDGGIQGVGAIFCTGNVTVRGGSDLSSDNRCAIVADGDVSLNGGGKASSYYQGLLYAGGAKGMEVSGVTLVGCAVVSSPSGGTLEAHDANVVFEEEGTHVEVEETLTGYPANGFAITDLSMTTTGYLRLKASLVPPGKVPTLDQLIQAGITSLVKENLELVDVNGAPVSGEEFDRAFSNLERQVEFQKADSLLRNASSSPTSGRNFMLDLNRFLELSDRLRVVLRR